MAAWDLRTVHRLARLGIAFAFSILCTDTDTKRSLPPTLQTPANNCFKLGEDETNSLNFCPRLSILTAAAGWDSSQSPVIFARSSRRGLSGGGS
jgi:hypothetical protein